MLSLCWLCLLVLTHEPFGDLCSIGLFWSLNKELWTNCTRSSNDKTLNHVISFTTPTITAHFVGAKVCTLPNQSKTATWGEAVLLTISWINTGSLRKFIQLTQWANDAPYIN